ncbi:putative Fe2+ transport system protein A FeoA [Herminiimonas arsenicoxydans]|uniref:Fe2+ transport system protein A FeoA n=1 Tax=Herminiimonas arsenicoxydans TaxID=204773 RepID=A4G583_HERAR|nr:putative Fe2+ transport system protein A FeoA [Herminiimonas arsenicoxydans]
MYFSFVLTLCSNTKIEYNENHCYLYWRCVNLSELLPFTSAVVDEVADMTGDDPIAKRLRELGFVSGEPVRIVARGLIGADPLLVQIGFTRFALRRSEAQRVHIHLAS